MPRHAVHDPHVGLANPALVPLYACLHCGGSSMPRMLKDDAEVEEHCQLQSHISSLSTVTDCHRCYRLANYNRLIAPPGQTT